MDEFCNEIETFLSNLKITKLELEFSKSMDDNNLIFAKIHGPENVLLNYSKKYKIDLMKDQLTKFSHPEVPYKCMTTILNTPNPDLNDEISKRAWETISKEHPNYITACERSVIVFAIMDYTKFSDNNFDVGLMQLIHNEVIHAAYPLHDGPWEWPDNDAEPLNDRQLLTKYWANFDMINKQQPLNLVKKYFGYEVAMYFAWLGFYNKMLVYASIMGVISFIYGIFVITLIDTDLINEICLSDFDVCPKCKLCKSEKLHSFCPFTYITYLHNNMGSVLYTVAIVIWCTVFKELWKRESNCLNVRWDKPEAEDFLLRPQFIVNANNIRRHKYTKELELYIPLREKIQRYAFSISGITMMIIIEILSIVGIILIECALKMIDTSRILVVIVTCTTSLIVMTIVQKMLYGKVVIILSRKELPRTQLEYEKSIIIKTAIFSFINSYGRLIYIAFFKGKFYTYPGDPTVRMDNFPISSEVCMPPGCIFEVFSLLVSIVIFKPFFENILEIFKPLAGIWIRRQKRGATSLKNKPNWEMDYALNEVNRLTIMNEFEEMIVQYGYVTFFAAAFPLAPIFALLNNLIEVRVDATKMIKFFQRPVERKQTSSIGVWFDILESMAYFAIITNALFMSFTCNYIHLFFYYDVNQKWGHSILNLTMSKYKITDNYWPKLNIEECYYMANRNPPDHAEPYKLTNYHYMALSHKLGFSLGFILVGSIFTGLISYVIPDMPRPLKEFIHYNEQNARDN